MTKPLIILGIVFTLLISGLTAWTVVEFQSIHVQVNQIAIDLEKINHRMDSIVVPDNTDILKRLEKIEKQINDEGNYRPWFTPQNPTSRH